MLRPRAQMVLENVGSFQYQMYKRYETCSNTMRDKSQFFYLKVISKFMMFRLKSFKMIYNMSGLLPYLECKKSLRNSFVFY